ncbi:hypothetical protein F8M41_026507 [Gigaspora margarita]|uniref:Uncharacterized protein n=1 Tax=Gigaspora margarita TaxID=4874 RepID=A0A8H3XGR5_GIGMA|nr:hypothetical protein F8M41_026507 [Gigaspora margarita]
MSHSSNNDELRTIDVNNEATILECNEDDNKKVSQVVESSSSIRCINKAFNVEHWYGDWIRVKKDGIEVGMDKHKALDYYQKHAVN